MFRLCKLLILLFAASFSTTKASSQEGAGTSSKRLGNRIVFYHSILDTIHGDDTTIYINKIVHWSSTATNKLPPNNLGKSLMTPIAWGSNRGGVLFASIAGTFPQSYATFPDMIAVVGTTIGNAQKILGGTIMLDINDVSRIRAFSSSIILSKNLSYSDAVSFGAIHILPSQLSDTKASYYAVWTHAVQAFPSKKTKYISALQYSVGFGSGRFYNKSHNDTLSYGAHGTSVFGNISYELFKWININAEWSGINVHAGVSIKPFNRIPPITMGIGDIIRSSGNKPRFLIRTGYSVNLPR